MLDNGLVSPIEDRDVEADPEITKIKRKYYIRLSSLQPTHHSVPYVSSETS